jgi:translation elongation factor EF-1beta
LSSRSSIFFFIFLFFFFQLFAATEFCWVLLNQNQNKKQNTMSAKAKVAKDFEIRTTGCFSVYCLKKEPAFKPVASVVAAAAAAAPRGETKTSGGAKKAAAADDSDDDCDDMFGDSDDDEEAEAAKQAVIDRIAAEHNAKKEAKRIAKGKAKRRDINSYVFDIKPYSIETDLEQMAQDFKKYEGPGVKAWGVEHVLIPVAFGIKKLRIQVICFGDDGAGNEFGEDDLIDIFNESHEDDIQSVDTHSFTKM